MTFLHWFIIFCLSAPWLNIILNNAHIFGIRSSRSKIDLAILIISDTTAPQKMQDYIYIYKLIYNIYNIYKILCLLIYLTQRTSLHIT